jgi:hypothetical protein
MTRRDRGLRRRGGVSRPRNLTRRAFSPTRRIPGLESPTRRLKPTKGARRGVLCDERKVFWFRLCEKGKLAKPSIDIILIVLSLTIFVLFAFIVSYYWR